MAGPVDGVVQPVAGPAGLADLEHPSQVPDDGRATLLRGLSAAARQRRDIAPAHRPPHKLRIESLWPARRLGHHCEEKHLWGWGSTPTLSAPRDCDRDHLGRLRMTAELELAELEAQQQPAEQQPA